MTGISAIFAAVMLLLASETIRSNRTLAEVVREMSFAVRYFAGHGALGELMTGTSRRLVVLTEFDISSETIHILRAARDRMPFAIIVAAGRASLRSSNQAELVDKLSSFENIEWVGEMFDFDQLSASVRRCRRRMLPISRHEVESAIAKQEFMLRYQPRVERSTGTEWLTREAEALVRWRHPEYGLMGPLEFLPEVEAFGLMGKLSEYVLREATQQLLAWRERGFPMNCCINLAASQLGDLMLAATYAKIAHDAGIDCASITFEVNEQDLAEPDASHIQMLKTLRKKGFRICLGDFRVTQSSLETFKHLPFDEIKIHASALRRAQNDRGSMAVLTAVTGLAHKLGISVCAEGVEDQETFEFLKTIECDKMQGFLISEAIVPSVIRRLYSTTDQVSANEVA
jgi:EAL domain-containing protein (putative c-di-GMP-specific phosphodiesterase class I)